MLEIDLLKFHLVLQPRLNNQNFTKEVVDIDYLLW
jgi:hypothetical protein